MSGAGDPLAQQRRLEADLLACRLVSELNRLLPDLAALDKDLVAQTQSMRFDALRLLGLIRAGL